MSTSTQNVFDFAGFTRTLLDVPRDRLSEVEMEIREASDAREEDVVHLLRRIAYKIKLQRLHAFLQNGEIPAGMSPQEEEAYEILFEGSRWKSILRRFTSWTSPTRSLESEVTRDP